MRTRVKLEFVLEHDENVSSNLDSIPVRLAMINEFIVGGLTAVAIDSVYIEPGAKILIKAIGRPTLGKRSGSTDPA